MNIELIEWEIQDSHNTVNPILHRLTMLQVQMLQASTPNRKFTVPGKVFEYFCDTFRFIPKKKKKKNTN